MKSYRITLEGTTPLLQHRMTDDELMGLLGTRTKKSKDKEEKTPREIAEQYAYKNERGYVIPTSYLIGAFRQVASEYKQKNSVRKSLKTIAGGVFRPTEEFAQLIDEKGKPLSTFEVDIKKATNHQKGAVAVCRPRFDKWHLQTDIMIDEELVSKEMVLDILNDSGRRSGIGSFRVSKGGYYGQFRCIKFEEIK